MNVEAATERWAKVANTNHSILVAGFNWYQQWRRMSVDKTEYERVRVGLGTTCSVPCDCREGAEDVSPRCAYDG